jgi:hypothetical protein
MAPPSTGLIYTPSVKMRRGLVVAVFVAVLIYTFRLYSFRCFLLDDFNALALVQRETATGLLVHVLNPVSDFYRPLAMLIYRLLWVFAGLDYRPYAWCAFGLHVVNTMLLSRLLIRLTRAPLASACGTLLFALQPTFAGVYFTFGTLFELTCATLCWSALLVHMRTQRAWVSGLAVAALLFLAIKCKEMAVSLPAICLAYDLLIAERRGLRELLFRHAPLALVSGWFVYLRLKTMVEPQISDPYHVEVSMRVLLRGLGWYWNCLVDPIHVTARNWGRWAVGVALGLAWLALRRDRLALFFAGCILFGLLPVLFLPNHRCTFYWYIPFLGVAGLATLLVHRLGVRAQLSSRAALATFCLLAVAHATLSTIRGRPERAFFTELCGEYRPFVDGMTRLPRPPRAAVIHFDSYPRLFDAPTLTSAARVIFDDPELTTTNVAPAGYRIAFEGGRVTRR